MVGGGRVELLPHAENGFTDRAPEPLAFPAHGAAPGNRTQTPALPRRSTVHYASAAGCGRAAPEWRKVEASNLWPRGHCGLANRLGSQPQHPPRRARSQAPAPKTLDPGLPQPTGFRGATAGSIDTNSVAEGGGVEPLGHKAHPGFRDPLPASRRRLPMSEICIQSSDWPLAASGGAAGIRTLSLAASPGFQPEAGACLLACSIGPGARSAEVVSRAGLEPALAGLSTQ
jgi:hypothetical protein